MAQPPAGKEAGARRDAFAPAGPGAAALRLDCWATRFQAACAEGDASKLAPLFHPDCHWRDLVLLSWSIVTFEGSQAVSASLAALVPGAAVQLAPLEDRRLGGPEISEDSRGTLASGWLAVATATARGVARVTLRADQDGDDRCAVLFTSMTELKGFEEPVGARRPLGQEVRAVPGRRTWLEAGAEKAGTAEKPYVLVVGGSQSGLMLAARLKRLQVPCLVVDRLHKPGDNWRQRYSSLHLHDAIWLCHLPYLPFPDHWPVFPSKDQFADWLDLYAQAMDIDFEGGVEVEKASYDARAGEWQVQARRLPRAGASPTAPLLLRPAHLVLATGNCGSPNIPSFPGLGSFQGKVMHSSQFEGCGANSTDWKGRRCVVVGANTSAHDIAQDLAEHGAEVTMLQRSPTCVVKTQRMRELAAGAGYSEEAVAGGLDAARADLLGAATPYALRAAALQEWVAKLRAEDAEFYARLDRVGWLQTWGEDETGPVEMFWRKFSGFYFDIGASDLLTEGTIKLQSGAGAGVSEVRPHSVVLTNGQEVPCEVLVLATGYRNMGELVAQLTSPEVAKAVGPCWGLGRGVAGDAGPWEGELRNMWKPTAQPGLWFQGGNIALCRFYSLHLALQLKARYEKVPMKSPPAAYAGAAKEP